MNVRQEGVGVRVGLSVGEGACRWGGDKGCHLVALDEVLLLLHVATQATHFCFAEGHLTAAHQLCLGVPPLQGLHWQHRALCHGFFSKPII